PLAGVGVPVGVAADVRGGEQGGQGGRVDVAGQAVLVGDPVPHGGAVHTVFGGHGVDGAQQVPIQPVGVVSVLPVSPGAGPDHLVAGRQLQRADSPSPGGRRIRVDRDPGGAGRVVDGRHADHPFIGLVFGVGVAGTAFVAVAVVGESPQRVAVQVGQH